VSIGIDTANKSTSGAANNISQLVWSHTVASNPQQVLFLSLAWLSTGGQFFPTSVSRGSQAFIPLGNASTLNLGSGRHLWSQIYRIVAPTVGAATITILFNGSGVYGFGGAITYNGVDQVTPTETPSVNFGTSTLATITMNGVTPDVVLDVVAVDLGPTLTVGTSQTSLWMLPTTQMTGASSYESTVGPTMTMTWSWSPARAWNNFAAVIRTSLIEEEAATESLGLGVSDNAVATIQVLASDSAALACGEFGYQTLPPVEGIPLHLSEVSTLIITDFIGIKLTILDTATVLDLQMAAPIAATDSAAVSADELVALVLDTPVDDTLELPLHADAFIQGSGLTVTETAAIGLTEQGLAAFPVTVSDSAGVAATEAAPTIATDFVHAVQAHVDDDGELTAADELLIEAAFDTTETCTLAVDELVDIFAFQFDPVIEFAVADTCVFRVITFIGIPPSAVGPFSDSVRVGAIEAPDNMRALGVLDSTRLTVTDVADVPIETVLRFLTESLRVVAGDVGTLSTQPFVQFTVTDSLKVQESALLTLGVLGAGSGGAESAKLAFTDARPNVLDLALKNVVDSCRWVLDEPFHVMQNPVGSDLPAVRTSDVLQPLFILGTVNKPVTEGCSVLLDEGLLLTRSVAVTDNSAVAVTEVTSLFFDVVLKTATDSCRIAGTEGQATVPASVSVSDSLKYVGAEVVQLPIIVLAQTTESVLLRHVDHTDSLLTVVVTVTATDSTTLAASEDVMLTRAALSTIVTDSNRIAVSETAVIVSTEVYLTVTDSLSITAIESSSLAVLLVFTVTDSLRITVVEGAPNTVVIFFDFNFLQVTDSLRVVATETAVRVIDYEHLTFTVTDSLRIDESEATDTVRAFFAVDSEKVAGTEVVSLFRDAVMLESLKWVVSEALLAAFITDQVEDTVEIPASETAALAAQEQAVTDALTISLDEAPAIAVVLTVTDSAVLGQADVALATLEVLTADTAAVACDELTDLQQQWNLTDEAAVVADDTLTNDFIAWEVADDVLVQLDAVLAELFSDTQAEEEIRWFIDSEHINQRTAGVVFITTLTEDGGAIQAEETFAGPSEYGVKVDDECAVVIGEEFADYELGRLPDLFIFIPESEQDDLQAYPFSYDTQGTNVW
jgi:hypothetical protein